ncbi:MAG TPA: hypothetical protein VMF90_03135 [Rhizobiaceae bacterium]|nr:hypothetical protein [Rhizobiaceae bacterium]
MTQIYETGTVRVVHGSTSFEGFDTEFELYGVRGGTLHMVGQLGGCGIRTISGPNAGSLLEPWPGDSAEGAYYIVLETAQAADAALANKLLADAVQRFAAGTYIRPNAGGSLADRAQYNGAPKDFIFVKNDANPWVFYMKRSDATADWSVGTTIAGPKGDDGDDGLNGIGDRFTLPFWVQGRPAAGEFVGEYTFTENIVLPSGSAIGRGHANFPATASSQFQFRKNGSGTAFATATFAIGQTVPVFAAAGSVAFAPGDFVKVFAPAVRDASLGDVSLTLAGSR